MQDENLNTKKLRKKVWQDVKDLVNNYKQQLQRFENPLFKIKKNIHLSLKQRAKMEDIYEELKKHMHNLVVLEEELHKEKDLSEEEKNVVLEASEFILSQIFYYIDNLSKKLNLDD